MNHTKEAKFTKNMLKILNKCTTLCFWTQPVKVFSNVVNTAGKHQLRVKIFVNRKEAPTAAIFLYC